MPIFKYYHLLILQYSNITKCQYCNILRILYDNIGAGPFISINSSMSMTVIMAPCRGLSDERFNSDPPGKPIDRQIVTEF